MKKLLLLFFVLACRTICAQSVYGTLTDSTTGDPVPYATILVKGTLTAKQTDENGSFTITPENYPATLVFVCMGYRTKEILVTQPYKVLKTTLIPSAYVLNEVVINSDPVQCIQKDLSLMCSAFEFCDNYLIVLAYRDVASPARLMLLDEYGNNVHTLYVSMKMEKLYRDCFGRMHLCSADSSWQVYYDYEKLQLIYPVARAEMEATFYNVDLYHAGKLFTHASTFHRQRSEFFWAYKGNNVSYHYTSNKTGENLVKLNYDLQYFLRMRRRGIGYFYSTDYIKTNLDQFQSGVRLAPKDSLALSHNKVDVQVIPHRSNVWLFDFTNNVVIRFDERMNKIDSITISFHLLPGWKGKILRDEATDKLYTTYEKNGILKVCLLHDRTFDIEKEWIVEDKPFPVNVRIKDDLLYFLWIDRTEYGSNRMLYKYRL